MSQPRMKVETVAFLFCLCLASSGRAGTDAVGGTLFVRADELLASFVDFGGVVVDVRDGEDYGRVHIPGSLNIPIHAIKTKVFLKPRDLVLVNAGFEVAALLGACRDLTRTGFSSVRVLEGGLAYWAALGGPIQGDGPPAAALRLVSPRALFQEKDRESLLIVDIDPSRQGSDILLPGAVPIPLAGGQEVLLRALTETARVRVGRVLTTVLVDRDGSRYPELPVTLYQALALADRPLNPFWLEGGRAGYQRFLLEQATMRDRRERKILKGGATCP